MSNIGKKIIGYEIGIENGSPHLTINDDGNVMDAPLRRYFPVSPWSKSDISPIIVSDKIVLALEAQCIDLISPYNYGHFEFILTYNNNFVLDGA